MRIVLINEACGVMQSLRKGLRELGHDVLGVTTYSVLKDKNFSDFELGFYGSGIISRLARCITPLFHLNKLLDYDVIQFIYQSSGIPSWPTRYMDLKMFKKRGARLGYYGLGCDEISLIRANPERGERAPCQSCISFDEIGKQCEKKVLSFRARASRYSHLFDFCISSSVDYKHCHDFFPNARHARIQLPLDISSISFIPAHNTGTTKIVHAPTRRGFKGTDVIVNAIELLKQRRNDFEFNIIEGISHSEYMRVMSDCDIYIDQIHSHGVGVAALENLAMGKIVLSGNSDQYKEWLPFAHNSPIIHAPDTAEQLAARIANLLEQKRHFTELAEAGRSYVEKNHNHILIAEMFVKHWQGKSGG